MVGCTNYYSVTKQQLQCKLWRNYRQRLPGRHCYWWCVCSSRDLHSPRYCNPSIKCVWKCKKKMIVADKVTPCLMQLKNEWLIDWFTVNCVMTLIQQPIQIINNTTLLSSNHTIYFSGNCDFEAGTLCSWVNLQNDDFDWLVGSGGTTSSFTGPTMDHTINQDNSGKTSYQ